MLCAGTHIGPYEILSALGAGGMGEVYRARDARLGRDVAVKVIPPGMVADPARLKRFEQEAQAAGMLNHPNLLAVYDFGTTEDGVPYLVTELLEGETLRQRLGGGAIPVRKAIDYALQIAHGLAAAHDKSIVHRDLKPENLFITRDGRVKILDFGLAKLLRGDDPVVPPRGKGRNGAEDPTFVYPTEPGTLLGTAGYMSPEQVRGHAVDHRTDLFSFGTTLYEMLSGRRAFGGDSGVETMYAILEEEPGELSQYNKTLPPALERIVQHALEKNPEERFQSARDLAFHLQAISDPSGSNSRPARALPAASPRRRMLLRAGLGTAATLAIAAAFITGKRTVQVPAPAFKQLTFRRGIVDGARFAPDGQTLVYSACWDGRPSEIFTTRADAVESRALGLPGAELLSVSSSGEVAVLLDSRLYRPFLRRGTLARVALGGGAPREIATDIEAAEWAPDGSGLAIVRDTKEQITLEYPIGKVLYSTSGWIGQPRFSPDGKWIAFVDHPMRDDDGGDVAVVDLRGNKKTLSQDWLSIQGLAWSPRGDEVWVTATRAGIARAVQAVSLSGKTRTLSHVPGTLTLHDVAADGRVLLTADQWRMRISFAHPGDAREQDLSWLDWSLVRDVSADGKWLLFNETGEGAGASYGIYVRGTDGSPAVRLGDGVAMSLSPDARFALAFLRDHPRAISVLPLGAGDVQEIPYDLERVAGVAWFPDGKRIVVLGNRKGEAPQLWEMALDGGKLRAITQHGVIGPPVVSPDGMRIVARDLDWRPTLYQVVDGSAQPLDGVASGLAPVRFTADGRSVYFFPRAGAPRVQLLRYDFVTNKTLPLLEIVPADLAGIRNLAPLVVTPDGQSFAYSYARILSSLQLVDGMR